MLALKIKAAACLALVAATLPAPAQAAPEAGWGGDGLAWTTTAVAPGVEVRSGVLQRPTAPYWTVTVAAPATNVLTGAATVAEVGSAEWASAMADRLAAAGFPARQEVVRWPSYTDTPRGVAGVRVRTGKFATQAEAQTTVTALRAAGFPTATAAWTGYDVDQAPDAERVHVAVVDPRAFRGSVAASHGETVATREKTSTLASKLGALVAVNGGFFVTSDADGYQGVPAGLAAYDGRLESLSAGSRAALVLGPGPARIANLTSTVTVRSGGAAHAVEGVNRKPGVLRNCGRPGAVPTTAPRQDFTCTSADELVLFTDAFGAALPAGAGTQVVLDASGVVVSAGARGGVLLPGQSAVQGIGASADWLAAHAVVGQRLLVDSRVREASGFPTVTPRSVVSAAPLLLRDGRLAVDAATEGVLDPRDLSFGYAWSQQRQPRTMAGIDARGRLLLVTVDGRQPGVSEGVTLVEGARLMRSLGAVDALNLDGGGSSAMVVAGAVVNKPSDAAGERAVGDVVAVLP
ncbi:phosphodiester glycosidase family protein [Amycolatopsis thermoflava]|uniref:phosphodiester glycosidase family protein n=1 Tax=Amycolatopsis thermoflava TaxID=84480 RepID=UPI000420B601|nr:phosphodiester glycosidase family protein [Amycolatopsis thermoflava]